MKTIEIIQQQLEENQKEPQKPRKPTLKEIFKIKQSKIKK